jgi:hypothetical protein
MTIATKIAILAALILAAAVVQYATAGDIERIWNAIAEVESANNPSAYNPAESAVGIAQIRPIYIADLNRIVGRNHYRIEDAWDPAKSREMFLIYTGYWIERYRLPDTPENRARIHNGGPRGYRKASTIPYWNKVRAALEGQG